MRLLLPILVSALVLVLSANANYLDNLQVEIGSGNPALVDISVTHHGEPPDQWTESTPTITEIGDKLHPKLSCYGMDRYFTYVQQILGPPVYEGWGRILNPENHILGWWQADPDAVYMNVIVDNAGNIHTVWIGSDRNLYHRQWDYDGNEITPLTAKILVNNDGLVWMVDHQVSEERWSNTRPSMISMSDSLIIRPKYKRAPAIAVDQSNNVHIVWSDDRPWGNVGGYKVFYTKISDGEILVDNKPISPQYLSLPKPPKGGSQGGTVVYDRDDICPAVGVNWAGDVYIVWQREYITGEHDIFYEKVNANGQTAANNIFLCQGALPSLDMRPNTDIFYLTWTDKLEGIWQVYVAEIDDLSEITACQIGEEDKNRLYPEIAYSPTTNLLLLTWYQRGKTLQDNYDVYYSWVHREALQVDPWKDYGFAGTPVLLSDNPDPDKYPSCVFDAISQKMASIAYQSWMWTGNEYRWEIEVSNWNEDEYIEVVVASNGDTAHYPLSPTSPLDEVTDYVMHLGLGPGTYTCQVIAKNVEGYEVSSETVEFTVPGRGCQSVEVEGEVVSLTCWAYPNSFTGSTRICFELPVDGHVHLEIYNLAGQLVETLLDEPMSTGLHKANWKPQNIASGVYFYRIQTHTGPGTKNQTATKKITVLR